MRLAAGNENERRHLLPLLDALAARGIRPDELWADRGYDSAALEQALRERKIEPRISKRRRPAIRSPPAHDPRGLARQETTLKTPRPTRAPPLARRTHQRLAQSQRRIATRRDRKADNYLAFLHLGMILILTRSF